MAAAMRHSKHPPKPPPALAVGIVGHRPNRLPPDARDKVAADIDAVLSSIAANMRSVAARHARVFSGQAVLSLVDSLAEGADRIAARVAATKAGAGGEVAFAIDAVLPFAADEFEKDFADGGSRAEFRALLDKARAVLVLPGERAAETDAYEAAAFTVLRQSDLVIAVWDGGPSKGRGGTHDSVQAAARDGLPIVIVDAKGEAAPRLHWSGLSEDIVPVGQVHDVPSAEIAEGLPLLVDALLRPPVGSAEGVGGRLHHQDEAVGLDRYFAERAPATNLQIGFPLLMAVFGVKRIARGDLRPKPPAVLAAEEMSHAPPVADAAPASARPGDLTGTYGWADFVGARLAQIFRSAFILNFVFAAFAVGCAAVSIVQHDWKPLLVWVEIALIVTVLINTGLGWLLQWHRRWLEGRELAERLRVALLLWLLGLRMAGASGAEATWTGWYARAAARAQGLRHARLDEAGVAEAREAAAELLDGQCRYHAVAAGRMHSLEKNLEIAGFFCLALTIVTALFYLYLHMRGLAQAIPHNAPVGAGTDIGLIVGALTAGLPALATATYGIRVIGDFAGISRRSQRTHDGVSRIVERLRKKKPDLRRTRAEVRAAADIMLGDVAGWRLSAESRGLAIPG